MVSILIFCICILIFKTRFFNLISQIAYEVYIYNVCTNKVVS